MTKNVVDVIYNSTLYFEAQSVYQYDSCQIILRDFNDLEYPYEIYFSNSKVGRAEKVTTYSNSISVPYKYMMTGRDVWAWVHIGGYTIFTIKIPVKTMARADASSDPAMDEIMARLAAQDEKIQEILRNISAVSDFFTDGYMVIEGMTAEERGQYM